MLVFCLGVTTYTIVPRIRFSKAASQPANSPQPVVE